MSNLWTPRGTHTSQKKRKWYSVSTAPLRAAMPNWKPEKLEAYEDASGLHIILTEEIHLPDSRRWLHISVGREDRYPTWEEILAVKEEFIGEEVEAYQVLPKASKYVNINPHVFHIWNCMDVPIMPE